MPRSRPTLMISSLAALALIAGACGGERTGGASGAARTTASSASTPADDSSNPAEDPGDADSDSGTGESGSGTSAGDPGGDDGMTMIDGVGLELLGWSRPSLPEGAESLAHNFGTREFVALHVRACLDDDVDILPHLLEVWTIGDADGEALSGAHLQRARTTSPTFFAAPEPGECSEGWIHPSFEQGLEPATAMWLDAIDGFGGDRVWPLGEPYPVGPLPLFGDILQQGEAWEREDGTSWTINGVVVPGPDDPLYPDREVESDMVWVVVDAVFCRHAESGWSAGSFTLVADGWAAVHGRGHTVEHAIEPAGSDDCRRSPYAVAMPPGVSVTAVADGDHRPPWWSIDPPVEIAG